MSHKEAFFIASVSCVLLGTNPQGFWVPEPFLYNPTRVPQTMARLLLAMLWSHRTFYLEDIGCIQKRFLVLAPQSSLVCPCVGKGREEPVFSAQHSLHQLRDTDQEPTVCQALSLFLWSQIWNKSLLCARLFPYSSAHRCETRAYCVPGTFSIPQFTDMNHAPTVGQALSLSFHVLLSISLSVTVTMGSSGMVMNKSGNLVIRCCSLDLKHPPWGEQGSHQARENHQKLYRLRKSMKHTRLSRPCPRLDKHTLHGMIELQLLSSPIDKDFI